MKEVDVVKVKKALNKFVVKSPLATRSDVINRMIVIVEEMGFAEIPVELVRFVMSIPLEVQLI